MKSTYKKRSSRSLCLILFAVCFLYANRSISQDTLATWQKQLNDVKNTPCKVNEGDASHLKLINYTYKGVIKSAIDKDEIIDFLLSCDAPVVMHLPPVIRTDTTITGDSCVIQEKSFPKFEIVTIRKMMEIAETIGEENPVIQMRQQLGQLIQVGFEYLELEWSYKGDAFNSLCIVSNENGGVVYEPVGGNITMGSKSTIKGQREINSR